MVGSKPSTTESWYEYHWYSDTRPHNVICLHVDKIALLSNKFDDFQLNVYVIRLHKNKYRRDLSSGLLCCGYQIREKKLIWNSYIFGISPKFNSGVYTEMEINLYHVNYYEEYVDTKQIKTEII